MIGTTEAAKLLNVSARRVRKLCELGRVVGAELIGKTWAVPNNPKVTASKNSGGRHCIIKMRKVKK